MEEKKVPALRFRGFDNAWEQYKLSHFAQRESVFRSSSSEYPSVEYEDVVSERGCLNKDIRLKETEKTGIAFDGMQVLYGKLRPYLHNWLNPDFTGVAVGDWWVLRPVGIDKKFLYRLIQTRRFDEVANQSSGSKMPRADWNLVSNTEFIIPYSLDEQRQIAETFDSLDHLISLHQRKLEMLKKVKKSMLEKMFPKNDAKVPEVRFSDFTDAWEQHKLGELSEKTYGGGTPSTANAEYWCGNIPWLQSSDIIDGKLFDVTPKKYISQVGLNSSAAQLIPENSIAIITRVGVGKLAFLSFFYTTSQDFLSMSRLTTEPYFTVYACYKKLQSELNSVQGTSIKGITKDELLAKEIKVPSYDEQKQIGEYFTNLDHLISLHQRKLEKLKNIKKSMLEKMFII